jgi:integrase
MALTDTKCRTAKAGIKTTKLSDGGGLQLWVQPSGSKLWQLAYRHAGHQRQLALGPYPELSLADARDKRTEAKKLLRDGFDPAEQKRACEAASQATSDTFREIAKEYVAKREREGLAQTTLAKKQWLLELADGDLGSMHISEIKAIHVLRALQPVEQRGLHETARRMRSTIGSVCRYAIATARTEFDPTTSLRDALTTPTVTPRAAITNAAAFGGLLRAIDGFDGQPGTTAALKLMALVFPRPGELRTAEWTEFDFADAIWTVPAAKTKMRRQHRMCLPRQAMTVLESLRSLTGHRDLLFPGLQDWRRPISENTLNGALRRLGFGPTEMTSHGFRASASTLLNESGRWSSDAIERQLAHIDSNAVRRAYARGEHWEERVRMMQWWADYLDQLKVGAASAKPALTAVNNEAPKRRAAG